jgi:cobalamin biosynthesis Mg chelatase CobN
VRGGGEPVPTDRAVVQSHHPLDDGDVGRRRHGRAVQQQRDDPLLALKVRIQVASRSAGRQGVVAGVDVVRPVLEFAATEVVPRLARTTDEISHIVHALNGGYVPAGPSESPLRGLVNVLPTGRNFYTVDPKAIPSRLAYATGQAMATSLVERYRQDTGDWPRSVGLSAWGTSAMRTAGDDVAEVLALTGQAPRAYIGDSTTPDAVRTRSLTEETARVFRARVVNPRWLSAMRRHGYKGAFELAATVDYLFGYDATAGVVGDWMYEQLAQAYALDPENQEFLRRSNPWALRNIIERLAEAADRGLWAKPDPATLEALRETYLRIEGDLEGDD